MSDDTPTYLELKQMQAEAQRLRDEAFEYRAEADRKLADANYLFGQASHRHRLIADLERSVQQREARLLNELGEAELIKREKIANEKLKQAEELIASVDRERHAAAININQLIEHDKRELAAAGIRVLTWSTTSTTPTSTTAAITVTPRWRPTLFSWRCYCARLQTTRRSRPRSKSCAGSISNMLTSKPRLPP